MHKHVNDRSNYIWKILINKIKPNINKKKQLNFYNFFANFQRYNDGEICNWFVSSVAIFSKILFIEIWFLLIIHSNQWSFWRNSMIISNFFHTYSILKKFFCFYEWKFHTNKWKKNRWNLVFFVVVCSCWHQDPTYDSSTFIYKKSFNLYIMHMSMCMFGKNLS